MKKNKTLSSGLQPIPFYYLLPIPNLQPVPLIPSGPQLPEPANHKPGPIHQQQQNPINRRGFHLRVQFRGRRSLGQLQ